MMEAMFAGRVLVNRLINFVEESIEKRRQVMPPPTIDVLDALQEEIYRMEQSLADMAARSNRVGRKPKLIEPITEQQKIIDLAG